MNEPLRKDSLEEILTFSVGVGRSLGEADAANAQAKADRGRRDNVVFYNGPAIADAPLTENAALDDYNQVKVYLHSHGAPQEVHDAHARLNARLTIDPKTGAYTKLGYALKRDELAKQGYKQGYYIFMDGDDMHGHNERRGRNAVDQSLTATGQAILTAIASTVRSGEDKRHATKPHAYERRTSAQDRRTYKGPADVIAHRVNEHAGDEFLVFVPLEHTAENDKIVQGIAQRILNHVYGAQSKPY